MIEPTAGGDLVGDGFRLLPNVLDSPTTSRLRDCLIQEAGAEREAGTAWLSGTNQRVYDLLNRGDDFLGLALHPSVLDVVFGLLSPHALLSSITGHIVEPGSSAQQLHADQAYIWSPWAHSLVANVVWMLDDFVPENGATRVVPGSHRGPSAQSTPSGPAQPIVAPAGSACVLDGRVLHGSGANETDRRRVSILALYCAPFIRQQENVFRSLAPHVRRRLDGRARRLLGYDTWKGLGAVHGLPPGWMRLAERTGPINTDGLFADDR
jgi:hypothetical protein